MSFFTKIYPEKSFLTMMFACILGSIIFATISCLIILFLYLIGSEKLNITEILSILIIILGGTSAFAFAFSILPMLMLGPPIAVLISKMIQPNSIMNKIIQYAIWIVIGASITTLIFYNISMSKEFHGFMLIGAIGGASGAYMWNKLMLNPSLECNEKA